ncbi:MAG: hypothetical protein QOE29_1078 [Gaiellaceae bacterium]|nr:hypothetical protein [Gaiellaceae bacterium]
MRLGLLTPWGLALALLGLVPVALALWRERTAQHARTALGLSHPSRRSLLARPLLLLLAFALLGLAAARPLVREQRTQRERSDAQLMLVLDNSRSMLASPGRRGTPRWKRAIAAAEQIHAAVPEVPVGVVALNDRVLPYLFPTTQEQVIHLVLHDSYAIDRPLPTSQTQWTTYLGAVAALRNGYFVDDAVKKVAVVLTDGETRTYSPFTLAQELEAQGIGLVYVRIWNERERIYRPGGKTERYEPISPSVLGFAQTGEARLFQEAQLGKAIADIRTRFGSGPTREVATSARNVSIGAQLALLGLCALLLAIVPGARLPGLRRRPAGAPATPSRRARVHARPSEPAARA